MQKQLLIRGHVHPCSHIFPLPMSSVFFLLGGQYGTIVFPTKALLPPARHHGCHGWSKRWSAHVIDGVIGDVKCRIYSLKSSWKWTSYLFGIRKAVIRNRGHAVSAWSCKGCVFHVFFHLQRFQVLKFCTKKTCEDSIGGAGKAHLSCSPNACKPGGMVLSAH